MWQDSSQSERLDKTEEKHIFVTRCLLRDKVQPFIKATVHVSKKQQQGFSSSVEVSFLSRVGNCFGETFASRVADEVNSTRTLVEHCKLF